jgi:hypothetical protein
MGKQTNGWIGITSHSKKGTRAVPNVFAPFGFALTSGNGSAPTFEQTTRFISSSNTTPIFFGDPVIQLTTGYIRQRTPIDAAQLSGVFLGCSYLSIAQQRTVYSRFWPGGDANGDVTAYITNDPNARFYVQAGNTVNPITLSGTDLNYGIDYGAPIGGGVHSNGNTLNGFSTACLSPTIVSGSTTNLPFRVFDLWPGSPGVNGSDPTTPFNWVIVGFNNVDTRVLTGTTTAS